MSTSTKVKPKYRAMAHDPIINGKPMRGIFRFQFPEKAYYQVRLESDSCSATLFDELDSVAIVRMFHDGCQIAVSQEDYMITTSLNFSEDFENPSMKLLNNQGVVLDDIIDNNVKVYIYKDEEVMFILDITLIEHLVKYEATHLDYENDE